jgi:acyl-CoA synthetase (NDP forming)
VLHDLRVAGKPTILLTLGASAASSRLARSHTGSLTTPIDVIDAACRAAGVARVHTPAEAIDLARASLAAVPMSGVRVAIVGDSGGQCGIAADAVASAGLVVPQLSEALTSQLTQLLPPGAASNNPIDLAGAGERDLRTYARVADQVLRSDEIDGVVLTGYFGSYGLDTPSLAEREADIAAQLCTAAADSGKPLVVHAMTTRSPAVERLWTGGVPVFLTIETASTTVSGLHRLTVIERPDAPLSEAVPPSGSGYWAARAWLETEGVRFPRAHRVRHETALAASMRALRAPYVLKADWLEHKTEAAGVVLDLVGERELRDAFTSMHGRLGDGTYIVEELDTRAAVVEMLVGAHRDPDLGPLIVVGLGGTLAELYRDTAVEMAPVTRTRAITMLRRLRAWPLLTGWRGAPPVDVEGLAGLVATLSRLVAALPDITDIEINPVRVGADGVLAVDALVVRAGADQ